MSEAYSFFYTYFLAVFRWVIPLVAVTVVVLWYKTLVARKPKAAVYAALVGEDGQRMPITFFETSVGRKKSCDIRINMPTVSRINAVITKEEDGYRVRNVSDHDNIEIDGALLEEDGYLRAGETLSIGGYHMKLMPPAAQDWASVQPKRQKRSPADPPGFGRIVFLLSLFTLLVGVELCLKYYEDLNLAIPIAFGTLIAAEWICYFVNLALGGSMAVELPAFFLTTLGFAVCSTAAVSSLLKELLASVGGFVLFLIIAQILKNIQLTMRLRYIAGAGALGLLAINLILAQAVFGSKNWISIGPITIQPSEFVKVAFVFAGAATLEHLLTRRNFILFMAMSAGCFGALALMKDFGTASIFFITMLIILFMRTGDVKLIAAILAASVAAGFILVKFVPHIARRFAAWGHVWQYASDSGYQQTRTMVAIGNGGLLGTGGGNGYLYQVFAADTDLVFGVIFEEWGGIIALCAVFCLVALALYAIWMCRGVRSSYYAIAIAAAAGMLLFQTALNIFGSTDILPLTGVTMPFVSNGGSSIVASWGLLAFFKAADRQLNLKVKADVLPPTPKAPLRAEIPVEKPQSTRPDFFTPDDSVDIYSKSAARSARKDAADSKDIYSVSSKGDDEKR